MLNNERLTMTISEAGKALGISRSLAYEAASRGEIPVIKVGKRILVPRTALEKMLQSVNLKTEDIPLINYGGK